MESTGLLIELLGSLVRYLIILGITYWITGQAFPYLLKMLTERNLVTVNYQGVQIPSEAGLIFVVLLPLVVGLGMLFSLPSFTTIHSILFLFVVLGMGFLGLLDDLIGTQEYKGFRGHFTALFKEKRLTSGGFKAIFGAIIAMVFSLATVNLLKTDWKIWRVGIDFLLLVLSANTVNLFDLRPGRAGKFFSVAFILIIAFSRDFDVYISLFLPALAILLYYLPYDLRARVMLGDVGSNLLGAILGVMMAWMLTDVGKFIAVIMLIGLQVAAEKFSFTKIIAETPWLRKFDEWGRASKECE